MVPNIALQKLKGIYIGKFRDYLKEIKRGAISKAIKKALRNSKNYESKRKMEEGNNKCI